MKRPSRGAYGKAPIHPATLGERIRRIRLAWNWSQSQLAEAIHTNQKTLSHWELDRQEPGEPAMGAMSLLFGLSIQVLRTGKGFKIPAPPRKMGELLVGEAYATNLVQLPEVGASELWLVDRVDGSSRTITTRKLGEEIRKAHENGRTVWVVLG